MTRLVMCRAAVGCLVLLVLPAMVWGTSFPVVENMSVTGELTAGQSGAVQVSCTAFETGGTITSVAVNLSQIGGSDSVALAGNGDQWTGSAIVAPSASDVGIRCVTFMATDSIDSTAIRSIAVSVADPSLMMQSSLAEGKDCAIGLSYTPTGGLTDEQSVTVDLSRIGGRDDVCLSATNNWTSCESVTPPVKGVASVPHIVTRTSATTRCLTAVTVTPPKIVVKVPGLRSEISIPKWIETNRLVQNHQYKEEGGWDRRIKLECASTVVGGGCCYCPGNVRGSDRSSQV